MSPKTNWSRRGALALLFTSPLVACSSVQPRIYWWRLACRTQGPRSSNKRAYSGPPVSRRDRDNTAKLAQSRKSVVSCRTAGKWCNSTFWCLEPVWVLICRNTTARILQN